MESGELGDLRKKEEHLSEWLRRYGKARDIVPDVQRNLDITKWEISALENLPTVAGEVPYTSHLRYSIARDYELTRSALPMMPDYDQSMIGTASSATTSGVIAVYNHVAKYGDINDVRAIEFSQTQTRQYREIQARQGRPKQVRCLMEAFCGANTLKRFDEATQAYLSSISGADTKPHAANAIRNVLYGLDGDLFKMAQATPSEQMTWRKMAQRLAKGNAECELLVRNETTRASIISGLSDILKDRSPGAATNLDNLWAQTLDFIYTVLNLLKPVSQPEEASFITNQATS